MSKSDRFEIDCVPWCVLSGLLAEHMSNPTVRWIHNDKMKGMQRIFLDIVEGGSFIQHSPVWREWNPPLSKVPHRVLSTVS